MSSFGKPYLDYQYTYENNMWVFHHGDQKTKSKNIGVIFDKQSGSQHVHSSLSPHLSDTLLKHGNWDFVSKQFNERYQAMKDMMELRLVWVPPEEIDLLNDAIAISAADYCSQLEDKVNELTNGCVIILEENNSDDNYLLNPPSSEPWVLRSPLRPERDAIDRFDPKTKYG